MDASPLVTATTGPPAPGVGRGFVIRYAELQTLASGRADDGTLQPLGRFAAGLVMRTQPIPRGVLLLILRETRSGWGELRWSGLRAACRKNASCRRASETRAEVCVPRRCRYLVHPRGGCSTDDADPNPPPGSSRNFGSTSCRDAASPGCVYVFVSADDDRHLVAGA